MIVKIYLRITVLFLRLLHHILCTLERISDSDKEFGAGNQTSTKSHLREEEE